MIHASESADVQWNSLVQLKHQSSQGSWLANHKLSAFTINSIALETLFALTSWIPCLQSSEIIANKDFYSNKEKKTTVRPQCASDLETCGGWSECVIIGTFECNV